MAGGFCCQSVSTAGKRAGLKRGTRTGLWFNYAEGIRVLRPSLIVAENVGGLLSGASVCDEDDRRWPKRADLLESAGLCSCRTPSIAVDGFKAPDQSGEAAKTAAQAYLEFKGDGPEPADLLCAACGRHVYEMAEGGPVGPVRRTDHEGAGAGASRPVEPRVRRRLARHGGRRRGRAAPPPAHFRRRMASDGQAGNGLAHPEGA